MNNKIRSVISGMGHYLPLRRLSNHDLTHIIDTSHEWIYERTGIIYRHLAAEDEYTSDLATHALEAALQNASYSADSLDAIILVTTTPDLVLPATAALVQSKIGAGQCMAFDLNAVCSGFVYGLAIADSLIKSQQAARIAVVGADTMSRIVDWQDRSTCVLFGDGAGSVILEASEKEEGILGSVMHCDGHLQHILNTQGGIGRKGSYMLSMQGREVFRHGVEKMQSALLETLQQTGVELSSVDLIIPHQANVRMIKALGEKLGIDLKRCVISVDQHANTAAASIPLALSWANSQGLLRRGQLIAMPAAGAGFTWGNVLVRL